MKNGIEIVFPEKGDGSEEVELIAPSDEAANEGEKDLIVCFLWSLIF